MITPEDLVSLNFKKDGDKWMYKNGEQYVSVFLRRKYIAYGTNAYFEDRNGAKFSDNHIDYLPTSVAELKTLCATKNIIL